MYFLSFLDWVKPCGYVKLRFQAKTKVSQTSVGFVRFAKWCQSSKKYQSGKVSKSLKNQEL